MNAGLNRILCFGLTLVLVTLVTHTTAYSQERRSGLISAAAARQNGLNVRWTTTVQIDPAIAQISSMKMHVDSKRSHTYFEILSDGERTVFSERHLDAYGEPLGRDGAKDAADERAQELKDQGATVDSVTEHVIPHLRMYVVTDAALLQAIDAETGKTLWRASTGNPRHKNMGPAVSDDFIAVVNGQKLMVFDAHSGRRLWVEVMDRVPLFDPVIIDEFVCIPTAAQRVITYDIRDPGRVRPHYPSFGRFTAPATKMGTRLVWANSKSFISIANTYSIGVEHWIATNDVVAHSPAYHPPNTILYATKHGTLYSMTANKPSILWRYPTGDWTHRSPIPIGNTVYYITDSIGLHAVSLNNGAPKWTSRGIGKFLSASDKHLYVLDRANRLIVLNQDNGSRIATFATEELDLTFTNLHSDRIFIGTRRGRLQCVHELANYWPQLHVGVEAANAKAPNAKPEGAPAAQPKPKNADPFGNDPFGAPKKGNQGGEAKKDPFGDGF